jgi:sensor histidine kinase regulating citrate/malate metabolism
LPAALFDSVAENLLHNALLKRQSEERINISVMLAPDAEVLSVCDTGSCVREDLTSDLLHAPVWSENGLGIGLYHAARQAESYGYELLLASNLTGRVCFELKRGRAAPVEFS